jgi:hypothetical protein
MPVVRRAGTGAVLSWLGKGPRPPSVPGWPPYDPIELPLDAFSDDVVEKAQLGRLPLKPASLPGVRSSLGWTREN